MSSAVIPLRAARKSCRFSKSTMAYFGIPPITRVSKAARHVIYTGAAPNQHIVPLAEYLLKNCGTRAYCIGSNYIWAWENNKIMREAVYGAGGVVLAERYFPVGELDFDAVIEQIIDSRPNFVFNTLIGVSAYAFFRAFRRAVEARGIDQPRVFPIASCSLAEPELIEIGPAACAGHVSSSVYFESIKTATNLAFVASYGRRFPQAGPTSADAEASYLAVHLLARAIRRRTFGRSVRGSRRPPPRRHRRSAGRGARRSGQQPLLPDAAHRRIERRRSF